MNFVSTAGVNASVRPKYKEQRTKLKVQGSRFKNKNPALNNAGLQLLLKFFGIGPFGLARAV
jgi:hypothetical protein